MHKSFKAFIKFVHLSSKQSPDFIVLKIVFLMRISSTSTSVVQLCNLLPLNCNMVECSTCRELTAVLFWFGAINVIMRVGFLFCALLPIKKIVNGKKLFYVKFFYIRSWFFFCWKEFQSLIGIDQKRIVNIRGNGIHTVFFLSRINSLSFWTSIHMCQRLILVKVTIWTNFVP